MENRAGKYEKILQKAPALWRTTGVLTAGNGQAEAGEEGPLWKQVTAETAACVLSPTLALFVKWVLKEAEKNGIKRLYFLARDGYLMYRTAVIFCEAAHIPIECRYFSCSRYSLRIPAYHMNHEAALEYICRGGIDVTLEKILYRAGLDAEEVRILSEEYFSAQAGEVLSPGKRLQVQVALAACPLFLEMMDRHSKEAYPGLVRYLKEEGLLDGKADAIVDSGWTGSMQKTLGELLASLGRTDRISGYYFGLYELPEGVKKEEYHCYLFGPAGNIKEKVFFNNCLYEAVYSAPHGMTLKYRDGPVYGTIAESQKLFQEFMEICIVQYMEKLVKSRDFQEENTALAEYRERHMVHKLYRLFMTGPTYEEAAVFGQLPFSDDVLDGGKGILARDLSPGEQRKNYGISRLLGAYGAKQASQSGWESAWYEGSAVLGGNYKGYRLFRYTLYKYLRFVRKAIQYRHNQR